MQRNPKIVSRKVAARSRMFTIETVDLRFANGARAQYERLLAAGDGAVMVAAIARDCMIMIREYAAGSGRYELGFVKGRIDSGETPQQAAQRELREEIGFGANQLSFLRRVDSAPAYTKFVLHIFTAADLFPHKLAGDEAEPPQIVEWPLARLHELYEHPEVNDARVLLTLCLLEKNLARK